MSPNPLQSYLTRRRTERVYREGGWGPQLTWEIPRAGAKSLVFQLRLPANLRLLDVPALAQAADGAPDPTREASAALGRAAQTPGVIVIGALCPVAEGEPAPPEVLATMTVVHTDLSGAAEIEEPSTPQVDQEVTRLSDTVTRRKRLSVESAGEDSEPVPVLMIEYLIQTRYGTVAIAFSTTREDMMGDWARNLFEQIMKTGFIGEAPQPI